MTFEPRPTRERFAETNLVPSVEEFPSLGRDRQLPLLLPAGAISVLISNLDMKGEVSFGYNSFKATGVFVLSLIHI